MKDPDTTELEKHLNMILVQHNASVGNKKRGYPIETQNYFSINKLKELITKREAEAFKDGYKTGVANAARIKQLAMQPIEKAYLAGQIDELTTFYNWVQSEGRIYSEIKQQFDDRLAELQSDNGEEKS